MRWLNDITDNTLHFNLVNIYHINETVKQMLADPLIISPHKLHRVNQNGAAMTATAPKTKVEEAEVEGGIVEQAIGVAGAMGEGE
ncbi:hypothetical protein QJS04_geneDACA011518 [Acorus gramineus]|uniref:Uncharacterized protein n=1 Tax=Acorus gramineus TaxID=55184 RepID=A0AAV9AEE2_ACOGR|nr:hypothetical protein QJS04_geneDACA011518 [Acorus gramineus]